MNRNKIKTILLMAAGAAVLAANAIPAIGALAVTADTYYYDEEFAFVDDYQDHNTIEQATGYLDTSVTMEWWAELNNDNNVYSALRTINGDSKTVTASMWNRNNSMKTKSKTGSVAKVPAAYNAWFYTPVKSQHVFYTSTADYQYTRTYD